MYPSRNKSDISYLKTSRDFNTPIYSIALLAAILCSQGVCSLSQVAARFISTLGQPHFVSSTLPLLLSFHLELEAVLDYSQ